MAARDEDLDLLKALRLLAFRAVEKPDHDYIVRHITRWYSRQFYTPLTEAEGIPLETLLTHFFEVQVEEMSDEDREELRAKLCETRAERVAREADEASKAVEDDEFLRQVQAEARSQNAKFEAAKAQAKPDDAPIIPVSVMGQNLPTTFADMKDAPVRPLPPDVKMTFVSESEMDRLEDWDLLGPPKNDKG